MQIKLSDSCLRSLATAILLAALPGLGTVRAANLDGDLTVSGGVGIGTATPDASAQLEVSSTSKGLLPPRLLAAARDGIAAPAVGLLVYQTDAPAGLYSYNGTAWVLVGVAVLPAQSGHSGQFLTTDGSTVSWGTAGGGGTVTSVSGTAPISVTNGTTTPAISLGTVGVANGGTGATTLTGYVKGTGTTAMTAAATIPGADISGNISGNAANVTGTVAVANGGTGATTAAAALTALLPTQTGNSGKVLTTNGSGASWAAAAAATLDYVLASPGAGSWTQLVSFAMFWAPVSQGTTSRGAITLDATYTCFTLKAGKTYELTGHVSPVFSSASAGQIVLRWLSKAGAVVGDPNIQAVVFTPNASGYNYSEGDAGGAIAVFTPAVDTEVKLQVTAVSNLAGMRSEGSYARIIQLP